MANKPSPTFLKSDGKGPSVDGVEIKSELLLGLLRRECNVIFPQLVYIQLRIHDVLHEPGEPIKFVYFMNSGLTSILNVLPEGKSVEVGLTGKEGFVGLPLLVGYRTSPNQAMVQIEGAAFRLKAEALAAILRHCPALEKRLQRYVQSLAMQATQVAACNRIHDVEEKLARWLLMCQDRIGSDTVQLTQEFLAHMLGTRRASVTVAAGILQKAGLIQYTRGRVKILDRAKLQDAACDCYEAMHRQTQNWKSESD
ncbi:MAG: Crp/Fnr family transcriptional regulator [Terriglobales bacterium]